MLNVRRHPTLLTSVSLLLLAVYVVASFGVVPSPRVALRWFGKVAGDRYPCEEHGCGCASGAECWTSCCCFSQHERLVWAIEHGVMPPAIAAYSDEQWIAAINSVKPGSAHCELCVERTKDELRQGVATSAEHHHVCDSDGACDGHCGEATSPGIAASKLTIALSCCAKNGASVESRWPGPSMSALACKGLEQLLTMTLPPASPVRVIDLVLPEPTPYVPERPRDVVCSSRALDVPEPPPRAC